MKCALKNEDFCIKNKKLFKNEGFCIKIDELYIKTDELCSRPTGDYVAPEGTGTRLNHWNATYNCYKCSDGAWIQMLGLESARHLPKFLEALGLADAGIGQVRFLSNSD